MALGLALMAEGASAQQPNLLGTWTAELTILRASEGKVITSLNAYTFVFEEHAGPLLQGYKSWHDQTNQTGNVAGKEVLEAKEPFIGVIEAHGQTVRLVETEDYGQTVGRLLEDGTLELTYAEPYPNAVAWTGIFRRTPE